MEDLLEELKRILEEQVALKEEVEEAGDELKNASELRPTSSARRAGQAVTEEEAPSDSLSLDSMEEAAEEISEGTIPPWLPRGRHRAASRRHWRPRVGHCGCDDESSESGDSFADAGESFGDSFSDALPSIFSPTPCPATAPSDGFPSDGFRATASRATVFLPMAFPVREQACPLRGPAPPEPEPRASAPGAKCRPPE